MHRETINGKTMPPMPSLVSPQWLADNLDDDNLRVLDASQHMAGSGRDARAEYRAGHIPGARFLDLASLVDANAPIENTLPAPDPFASRMVALGVDDRCGIVLYDDSAIKSAARAWFMLRLFGVDKVAILDGGLGAWRAEGRALAGSEEAFAPAASLSLAPASHRLRDKAALLANLASNTEQVVDARARARFAGTAPEPRAGLAAGHIPGSCNVPFTALFTPEGRWRDPAAIRDIFTQAGVDLARPVVASCGSGMTACVLIFALHLIGKDDVALYDGSWAEWGIDPATPKATLPVA